MTPPARTTTPKGLFAFVSILVAMAGAAAWLLQGGGPEESPRLSPQKPIQANVSETPPKSEGSSETSADPGASATIVATEPATKTGAAVPPAATPAPGVQISPAELESRIKKVQAMAEGSPADALRWAQSLGEGHDPVVIAATYELVRKDPAAALTALSELAPSLDRDAALNHAAAQWVTKDAVAATAWASAIEPGKLREDLCTAIAIGMAARNPEQAAEFVASQITDGVTLRVAAVSVAQRWAQQDPAAAKEWANEFPNGTLKDETLREIAAQVAARKAVAPR